VDKIIEVRYAGAVVSQSAVVRDLDAHGLFVGLTEPLPVGTEVTLAVGEDAVAAKVAAVFESQELTRSGMRVAFADPSAMALFTALADATPAVPMSTGSNSARVMTSLSASGSGSARVGTPASSAGSGPAKVVAPVAPVSSAPVVESKPAAPVPVSVGSSAPVAAPDAADDVVDVSGPVASSEGGAADGGGAGGGGAGGPAGGAGGGGGGGRRNRRNRRR